MLHAFIFGTDLVVLAVAAILEELVDMPEISPVGLGPETGGRIGPGALLDGAQAAPDKIVSSDLRIGGGIIQQGCILIIGPQFEFFLGREEVFRSEGGLWGLRKEVLTGRHGKDNGRYGQDFEYIFHLSFLL